MSVAFPFSAVVGNDELKLALILGGLDPRIGGVLIEGDKGTAKTTLARGLKELLPAPAQFVELPLGTTEERLKGSIDLEHLLREKTVKLQQGLLGKAHGGILYVDEINLLSDHLVDLVLDAVASGENRIERDQMSVVEPASLVLVGSMNKEEGWLRPQLLDRFGLYVRAEPIVDSSLRIEATKRRLSFDANQSAFYERYRAQETALATAMEKGRAVRLSNPDGLCATMTKKSWDAVEKEIEIGQCRSLRADLVLVRAACAYAYWSGSQDVLDIHVHAIAPLVMGHRRSAGESQSQAPRQSDQSQTKSMPKFRPPDTKNKHESGSLAENNQSTPIDADKAEKHLTEPGFDSSGGYGSHGDYEPVSFDIDLDAGSTLNLFEQIKGTGPKATFVAQGKRPNRKVISPHGSVKIGTAVMEPGTSNKIDIVATFSNALLGGTASGGSGMAITTLWGQITQTCQARLVIVVLDTSGSMGAQTRIELAKQVLISALSHSYQKRNRVALVGFSGDTANVLVNPTRSVELVTRKLSKVATGGYSPIGKGIDAAVQVAKRSDALGLEPLVLVISDCRATSESGDALLQAVESAKSLARAKLETIFIDLETGHPRLGLASKLAAEAKARVVKAGE